MNQINGAAQVIKSWKNYDNSPSLILARVPWIPAIFHGLKIINETQYSFIRFAREHDVFYANAMCKLPLASSSCDAVYSSHMLEHLDQRDAERFLKESMRVLCSGGIIRLVVPDLAKQISRYIKDGDADLFVAATHLTVARPATLATRLKLAVIGPRQHLWMYDGNSLAQLLNRQGFSNVSIIEAGQTAILNAGALDLHERRDESVYVEATKP